MYRIGMEHQVIRELTTMSLVMWNNRCGCMYVHNADEEKRMKKERLREAIQESYLHRAAVPQEFQRMFVLSLNDFL